MQLNFRNIDSICRATDDRLWDAYNRSTGTKSASPGNSRLIFPIYSGSRNGELRVSEQEARFAFAESIAATNHFYSIETPTKEGYQLTGSRPISAQTDLTVYDSKLKPILNVEFKAKGASTSARSLFSIQKDLQKLLREPIPGMWFHILEAVDNATISKLFGAIVKAVSETVVKFQSNIQKKLLIFHFCILRQRFSLNRQVEIDLQKNWEDNLKSQFQFSYTVTRSSLLQIKRSYGWHVNRSE